MIENIPIKYTPPHHVPPEAAWRTPAALSAAFYRRVAAARQRVLLLDYDGTLAPFRVQRNEAAPYPGVRPTLQRLIAIGHTRLVIISGRALADLIGVLGLEPAPELWGSHGWERRRPDGRYETWPLDDSATRGLNAARHWIERQGLRERCELKPASLAVHWRGLSDEAIAALELRAGEAWGGLAAAHGLQLLPFHGGLELRAPGRTKGDAVRAILADVPRDAVVAYLGDDRTDEEAFAALDHRGLGVLVNEQPRRSGAEFWLRPPEGVLDLLAAWVSLDVRSLVAQADAVPGNSRGAAAHPTSGSDSHDR